MINIGKSGTSVPPLDLFQGLSILQQEAGRPLFARVAQVFLLVAVFDPAGIDHETLGKRLDVPPSAVSRAVDSLTERHWKRDESGNPKEGLGWVKKDLDPRDHTRRVITLTERGRKVFDKLMR